jgi:hypothetical protein
VTRARLSVAALVGGLLAGSILLQADRVAASSLYVDCWFSKKSGKLTVRSKNSEQTEIRRSRKRILVFGPGETACKGGKPTVRNTRVVKYLVKSEGIDEGHLSLAGARFAPGRGGEADGTPEIEFRVVLFETESEFHLDGTRASDHLRAGSLGNALGINMNPSSETTPDVDLRLTGRGATWLAPGAGNDFLDLSGGAEFLGSADTGLGSLLGPGADRFTGSAGADFVIAGEGVDIVSSGAGDDAVNTQDGMAETVDCGDGQDVIQPDGVDLQLSCEELGFVGFAP